MMKTANNAKHLSAKLLTVASMLVVALATTNFAAAQDGSDQNAVSGAHGNVQISTGHKWDHCREAWHGVGANKTWCYLESNKFWVWTTDDRAEQMLIACAGSDHWCGFNFTSTSGSWNYMRLWKY